MRRNYDNGYLDLLTKVREKAPKYYGVLVKSKYPAIERGRFYNVINLGVQDWDALKALADVLEVETKELV